MQLLAHQKDEFIETEEQQYTVVYLIDSVNFIWFLWLRFMEKINSSRAEEKYIWHTVCLDLMQKSPSIVFVKLFLFWFSVVCL